jgi:hypothetical protein
MEQGAYETAKTLRNIYFLCVILEGSLQVHTTAEPTTAKMFPT